MGAAPRLCPLQKPPRPPPGLFPVGAWWGREPQHPRPSIWAAGAPGASPPSPGPPGEALGRGPPGGVLPGPRRRAEGGASPKFPCGALRGERRAGRRAGGGGRGRAPAERQPDWFRTRSPPGGRGGGGGSPPGELGEEMALLCVRSARPGGRPPPSVRHTNTSRHAGRASGARRRPRIGHRDGYPAPLLCFAVVSRPPAPAAASLREAARSPRLPSRPLKAGEKKPLLARQPPPPLPRAACASAPHSSQPRPIPYTLREEGPRPPRHN